MADIIIFMWKLIFLGITFLALFVVAYIGAAFILQLFQDLAKRLTEKCMNSRKQD